MYYALRTIGYFVTWGTFYGLLLGLWATTIMLPVLGTIMGVLWGPGVGAVSGLGIGILVAIIQALTFHEKTDLTQYQRRLSYVVGLLAAVGAPILVFATSESILWTLHVGWQPEAADFLIPSLISATFWGGLSAAYVARSYVPWLANLKLIQAHKDWRPALKTPFRSVWVGIRDTLVTALAAYIPARWLSWIWLHENETTMTLTRRWHVPSMTYAIARELFRLPLLIATIFIMLYFRLFYGTPNSGFMTIWPGMLGSIAVALMLVIGHGTLMPFIRQTFLNDDEAPLSPLYERRILTGVAVVFTIILAIYYVLAFNTIELWPALIPWPLLIGLAVYRAFPHFNLSSEKAKRKEKNASDKPKNALALDEESEAEDVYESEAAALSNITRED